MMIKCAGSKSGQEGKVSLIEKHTTPVNDHALQWPHLTSRNVANEGLKWPSYYFI